MNNGNGVAGNPTWVGGKMQWDNTTDNTNASILVDPNQSAMAEYVKTPGSYKCPSDTVESLNGDRVRSVAMNGALGNKTPTVTFPNTLGRSYFGSGAPSPYNSGALRTINLIPAPVNIFVLVDQQADSICFNNGDATFAFDPGANPAGGQKWRDLPASYHNGCGSFSFADGHSEIHKWTNRQYKNIGPGFAAQTVYPVIFNDSSTPWTKPMAYSIDYEWMQDAMPYGQ